MFDRSNMWSAFFALRTLGELRRFLAGLDESSPEAKALLRYANTWAVFKSAEDSDEFVPQAYVSEDLSAAVYAGCPCVFMGTNSWALAPVLGSEFFKPRLSGLTRRIGEIRDANPDAVIIMAVIPEKDYTINRMFVHDGSDASLRDSMNYVRKKLAEFNISLIFDEYVEPLASHQTIQTYHYPDSHLPSANYLQSFARFMHSCGANWQKFRDRVSLESGQEYCDLSDKLVGSQPSPVEFSIPKVANENVVLTSGNSSFSDPLGETKQVFRNDAASDERTLLILGDSHSSIYDKKKMTFLGANVFASTEFQWNPCGFRNAVGTVKQSVIFLEVSQRFLFTN